MTESSHIFYSSAIHNAYNNRFCTDMVGCRECISCSGLVNASYCIGNKQYTKDEFLHHKQEVLSKLLEDPKIVSSSTPYLIQCDNVTGDNMLNCYNLDHGYNNANVNTGNNVMYVSSEEDNELFFDVFMAGRSDNFYGVVRAGTYSSHCYCSYNFHHSNNLYYCSTMDSCSYCLGCIGLKNKSFCIFNKQYTKEERHEKIDEIFTQMEKDGTLGEFFPGSMNPFYFNDTAAYLIDDSFTKEEVEAAGYLRRDEEVKVDIPIGAEVVKTSELGEYEGWETTSPPTPLLEGEGSVPPSRREGGRWRIDPDIMNKVIQDESGNVYRIVKMEYDFLMKHGLPLPRLHWLERLKMNFKIS